MQRNFRLFPLLPQQTRARESLAAKMPKKRMTTSISGCPREPVASLLLPGRGHEGNRGD